MTSLSKMQSAARFQEALAKQDWKGMAAAFAKGDMLWHADEWKRFITDIQASTREHVLDEVEAGIIEKLKQSREDVEDNSDDEDQMEERLVSLKVAEDLILATLASLRKQGEV